MLCECNYGPSDRCPAHSERLLSLFELREQRTRERQGVPREEWLDTLPHAAECKCPCHTRMVDDGTCDGIPFTPASNPPVYVCCYDGPRRPLCAGCGKSSWRVRETEGLLLCRACRKVVR
jgi:hypothetical protein